MTGTDHSERDGSRREAASTLSLTVCIPVYNGEDTIERCLVSVLDQTFGDFECLVVDNASTDSTVAKIRAFDDPRVRVVVNPENVGVMRNHNLGLKLAHGDVIQYVHADDWLLPTYLERLFGFFDDPRIGLAFAPRLVETSDLEWKTTYGRLEKPLLPLHEINAGQELIGRYLAAGGGGNSIGEPTSVMLRRATLVRAGGFRVEAPQLSDIDAWLRVLVSSDAAFVDEELSVRWHHDANQTARNLKTPALDRMWVMSSMMSSTALDPAMRRAAFTTWLRSLAHAPMDVIHAPHGDRHMVLGHILEHVRRVVLRRHLTFDERSYTAASST